MSNILDIKRFKTSDDVTVTLFNRCNLNCPFCYLNGLEDRKNEYKINYDVLLDKVKKQIEIYPYDYLELKLLGGELFSDDVPNEIFNQYYDFIKNVYDYAKKFNKKVCIYFTSNLVHENYQRVSLLLDKIDELVGSKVKLCSSFDFFNRFHTNKNFELFKKNIEYYSNRIVKINVLLDKNVYDMFINKINYNTDMVEYFNYLYKNFSLFLGNIVPINSVALNNEEKAEIYKYFVDNYPNIYPINKLFFNDNEIQHMHCDPNLNEIQYNGDIKLSCFFNNYYHKKVDVSRNELEMRAIVKRGCLKCEHYKMCIMPCLYGTYLSDIPKDEICYLKQTIEYIREKNGRSN